MDEILRSGSVYEDQQTVVRIQQAEVILEEQFRDFINEQLVNFAHASGKIYSSNDLRRLRQQKRPAFQINLFHQYLVQQAGNFKGNLPGIEISGVTRDDHDRAGMFNDVNNYILHTGNDFSYELAKAYLAAVIGRISFMKQEHTYRYDDEGMVDLRYYNKLLKFDTATSERRFETCQFMSDNSWFSPEELIAVFASDPGKNDLAEEIEAKGKALLGTDEKSKKMLITWAERNMNLVVEYGGENAGYDASRLAWDMHGDWHNDSGRMKTVDWYERRLTNKMYLYDRVAKYKYDVTELVQKEEYSTSRDWVDNEKLALVKTRLADPEPYKEEKKETIIWQVSVVPFLNMKVFDAPQQLQNKNFKFTPIMCFDFHPDILETKSLIDVLKDNVKSYNHMDNMNLTYLMRSALGGAYVEKSAVKGLGDQINNPKIAGFTVLNDGALSKSKLKEKSVPAMNTALAQQKMTKQQELDNMAGSGPASRGIKESSNESGKHAQTKIAQSEVMQEWASENAQAAGLQESKNNVWYIQNFFTEERTFKITLDRENPYWLTVNKKIAGEVLNDTQVGKYDVSISTTPYGRLAKEQKRNRMLEMIQILGGINPMYVDPREIIMAYDPPNKQRWLDRIEMFEGISLREIQLKEAMGKLDNQAQGDNLVGSRISNAQNLLSLDQESKKPGEDLLKEGVTGNA